MSCRLRDQSLGTEPFQVATPREKGLCPLLRQGDCFFEGWEGPEEAEAGVYTAPVKPGKHVSSSSFLSKFIGHRTGAAIARACTFALRSDARPNHYDVGFRVVPLDPPPRCSDRYPMTVILSAATSRRLVLHVSVALLVAMAACSDGGKRTASSPTSPSASVDGATSDTAGADGSSGPASEDVIQRPGLPGSGLKGSRNVSLAVEFPPRDGTFQFRQQLEISYRDALRRSPTTSFVDIEGTIVWTQEYLRYRVNGCTHQDAITRVTAQIQGRGIQPVCADFTGTSVNFPPRNEPFAFRQELERLYRDDLRRSAVQTFVDAEGDIVWTQEYLRYRLNGCSHTDSIDRTLSQVTGGPVQPVCTGTVTPPPPPSTSVTTFVSNVTAPGASTTLVNSPRPNAGAGPIVTPSSNSGSQITLTASTPVDRIIVSVNTTGASSTRLTPFAVVGSYYEVRLSSPQTTIQLTIQGAGAFNLEFAAALGTGPLGPYQPQPFSAGINLTGRFVGTGSSEFGTNQVVFVLTQTGTRVTGTAFAVEAAEFANIFDGTLNGTTLTFTLRFPIAIPECSGFESRGTAQVTANTIVGTITSSGSCLGIPIPTSTGNFSVTRQ